jgi:hypothetical protein
MGVGGAMRRAAMRGMNVLTFGVLTNRAFTDTSFTGITGSFAAFVLLIEFLLKNNVIGGRTTSDSPSVDKVLTGIFFSNLVLMRRILPLPNPPPPKFSAIFFLVVHDE